MNTLENFIATRMTATCGFLTADHLAELAQIDRLCPVLVRCGGGRFTCPAQDAQHLIGCVRAGGDYVRDVCLPSGSLERAALWRAEPVTHVHTPPTAQKPAQGEPASGAGLFLGSAQA